MICPFCHVNDDRVIDSRSSEGGRTIRRRRLCNDCGKRFTTYERVENAVRIMVIKRDGSRQAFDALKILRGIEIACGKRPVAADQKQHIVDQVEEEILRNFDREVPSAVIGEQVSRRLRRLDQVAHIRFASEYKQFRDVDDLIEEANDAKLLAEAEVPGQQDLFAPSTEKTGDQSE